MKAYPYSLETDRLLLRSFEISDRYRIYEIAGAREIYESTVSGHFPYNEDLAEGVVVMQQYRYFQGKRIPFAITLRDTGVLIGAVVLIVEKDFNRAEIGYWLGVSSWGRGYATESAKAVLTYGFKELGYHRIYAWHMATNPASGRVLQKIGLKHEGTYRDRVLKDGTYRDIKFYGMLNPYE